MTRVTTRATEGMVKLQVVFLKPIIILWGHIFALSTDVTRHGHGKNVFLFIKSTCAVSMEMCVMMLWKMSKYCYTMSRTKQGWNKHVYNNTFSCLQSLINLYCKFQKSILIKSMFILLHNDKNRYKWKYIPMKISCVNGYTHCIISWEVIYLINKNWHLFSTFAHTR